MCGPAPTVVMQVTTACAEECDTYELLTGNPAADSRESTRICHKTRRRSPRTNAGLAGLRRPRICTDQTKEMKRVDACEAPQIRGERF